VLSFKTRDHGHEAKIDCIEDKPLKKSKNLKKKKLKLSDKTKNNNNKKNN